MKIKVNRKTVFAFPNCLIANGLVAGAIRRKLKKEGVRLTRKQTRKFLKVLRGYKRTHGAWQIVEIGSHKGNIEIWV